MKDSIKTRSGSTTLSLSNAIGGFVMFLFILFPPTMNVWNEICTFFFLNTGYLVNTDSYKDRTKPILERHYIGPVKYENVSKVKLCQR